VSQYISSAKKVAETEPVIFVVDDDDSMRRALVRLLHSVKMRVQIFASAEEFFRTERPDVPSCIVLDVRLPGLSGLDFQAELAKEGTRIPIVFITGHGDIPMTVQAIQAGAIDFLEKPFRDQDLLDAVARAIQRDQQRRVQDRAIYDLRVHFELLTPRERQIMVMVTEGLMSKQIAAKIDLSEITVKIHRSHLMKKMNAKTVAELVKMVEALGIARATAQRQNTA
jgi:FixJ family two-component response regulator